MALYQVPILHQVFLTCLITPYSPAGACSSGRLQKCVCAY